jgi:hypothetical protein
VKLQTVRKAALSLPDTTEEPHHHFGSFRVRGKIFITMPPGDEFIHLFLRESDREFALAVYPEFVEKLLWGGKVVGVRVTLENADTAVVKGMIRKAYTTQANKPPAKAAKAKTN